MHGMAGRTMLTTTSAGSTASSSDPTMSGPEARSRVRCDRPATAARTRTHGSIQALASAAPIEPGLTSSIVDHAAWSPGTWLAKGRAADGRRA